MADNTNFLLKKSSTNGSDVLFNSILGAYYMKLSIGKYVRPTPFTPTKWTPEKGIILPLPTELHDETSVSYQTQDMVGVGDALNRNWEGLAARSGLNLAKNLPGAAANFIGAGEIFPADAIATAIQQINGVATNPNTTVAFKGPELRTFAYSWLLQPRNVSESNKIQTVIKYIKSRALPANSLKDQVSILDYPSLCQVNFYPWDSGGGDNDWGWSENSIIRYKKCFISSVNVDYTPSNVPAFFQGSKLPVAIRLSLGFSEIEFMLANDWMEGSNNWRHSGSETLESLGGRLFNNVKSGFNDVAADFLGADQKARGFADGLGMSDDPTKAQQ